MTQVYYDDFTEALVVEGARNLYLPKALMCAIVGNSIELWLRGQDIRILGPIVHSEIKDRQNNRFPDILATKAYLDAELAKEPDSHEDVGDLVLLLENQLL